MSTFADREYSFFEFKNIDWDSIYSVYRPLVNDDMNSEELFDVIDFNSIVARIYLPDALRFVIVGQPVGIEEVN